jgi:hypothetical protein
METLATSSQSVSIFIIKSYSTASTIPCFNSNPMPKMESLFLGADRTED